MRAPDEERTAGVVRLPEVAGGAELNVQDAEEWRGEDQEEGARQLGEAEGLLEDADRRRSEEDLGELAAAKEIAEMEWCLAQSVEEQVAV